MTEHSWPVWLPILGVVVVLGALVLVVVLACRRQP